MSVSLKAAHELAESIIKDADGRGLRVGVAVVNERGGTVLVLGMDGVRPFTPDTAKAKALGTVLWGMPGQVLAKNQSSSVFEFVNRMHGDRVIYAEGSALLKSGEQVDGAVGVSGAQPAVDEELAQAAAERYGS